MKRLLVILCAVTICLGIVGSADALTIGFDSMAPGHYSSVVYPEVTITNLSGGDVTVADSTFYGGGYSSPLNGIYPYDYSPGNGKKAAGPVPG